MSNSYSMMGVKSNGLLFYLRGFPDAESKAFYRFNKRLRYMMPEWDSFFTFTISDSYETFVPMQDWQRYTNYYYTPIEKRRELLLTDSWDFAHFNRVYAEIKDYIPLFVSRFFNKLQQWYRRQYGTINTYMWKLERGEKGRLHVHVMFKFNINEESELCVKEVKHIKFPRRFLYKVAEYWNCGYFNFVNLSGTKRILHVMTYLDKYFSKKTELNLPSGTRRYSSTRDIPGYKPNKNVFYINESLIEEHCFRHKLGAVNMCNEDWIRRFIKLWKVRFFGFKMIKSPDGKLICVADIVFVPFTKVTKLVNYFAVKGGST